MQDTMHAEQAGNTEELQQAAEVRRQVFVDEQGIPAATEEDGLNEQAIHVLLKTRDRVAGTARLCVMDKREGEIARVAILREFRGQGHGRLLVRELEKIALELGLQRLVLHPHHYLERFYAELGYALVPGETTSAGEHLLITMEKILPR